MRPSQERHFELRKTLQHSAQDDIDHGHHLAGDLGADVSQQATKLALTSEGVEDENPCVGAISHGVRRTKEEAKMHRSIFLRWLICAHLIVLFFLTAGHVGAQTEEKLLDDINQLPEAERQARLVNGAKKKGPSRGTSR